MAKKFKTPSENRYTEKPTDEKWVEWLQKDAQIGAWSMDLETYEVWWSEGTSRIYELDDPKQFDSLAVHGEKNTKMFEDLITHMLNTKEGWEVVFDFTTNSGVKKWGRSTGIYAEANGRPFVYGTFQDVTEIFLQMQELTMDKQLVERSSKFATIGELSAQVGHEVNNPLTICFGHLKKLQHKLSEMNIKDKQINYSIDKSFYAMKRIKTIVNGLKSVAYSADEVDYVAINVNEVIKVTIDFIQEIFRSESIVLDINLSDEKLWLYGNEGKLQQAIMNLMTNARDAIRSMPEPMISISTSVDENMIVINVSDNGPGIPEEFKERVFNSFFTTKEKGKGTGIGLPLTYQIVQEHGGDIKFSSTKKGGTSFTILLPLVCTGEKVEDAA
jgi:signal transduction histidine kinase